MKQNDYTDDVRPQISATKSEITTNFTTTGFLIMTAVLSLIISWVMTQFFNIDDTKALIYTHVVLGSLAFLVGAITLFSKKGSPLHKITGKVFYIAMVVSVSITLVVSMLPDHWSPTMFQIGILSLYFLVGGKRSINYKKTNHGFGIDLLMASIVVIVSLLIMSYSVIQTGQFHPLRTVFGTIGITFGLMDIKMFTNPKGINKKWLVLHLSKMIGGYTAAVTAFFVAQNILWGYFNWFTPTVIGLLYLLFWMIKLKVFKSSPKV